MADGIDDQLARTATAPGRAASIADEKLPSAGESLGRYRLERELGAGGMGVVFAAFDSKLERRVALKVLRGGGAGSDANRRLLNEARAMARLTHSNVVTVHEADSVGGRDYVAMELIDGATLAEWMRIAPRTPEAIVAAFVAAGRGLAAAHGAGLVHRDFKPHNVLRRTDGRIAVTDFGLARDAGADPMAVTVNLGRATNESDNTPSALSGLTVTGSLLGTPAYMAPEQWNGGKIGPAADQFAFCVALWEALVGERPYRGDSFEALKEAIGKGPAALDGTKLPKALRAPLARGLDPDPTKRWPTMTALLDALERTIAPPPPVARRGWLIGMGASAFVVGIAIAVWAARGKAPVACRAPAHDPATIWPQPLDGHPMLGKALDTDLAAWKGLRADACAAEPEKRDPMLTCLDGVLSRLDLVRHAAAMAGGAGDANLDDLAIGWLVEPSVCKEISPPPRLALEPSPAVVGALVERFKLVLGGHAATGDEPTEPCAKAITLWTRSIDDPEREHRDFIQRASGDADRCGDDRLRADLAVAEAWKPYEQPRGGSEGEAAIVRADSVTQHVLQGDLSAQIEGLRAVAATQRGLVDAALALRADATRRYKERGRIVSALESVDRTDGQRMSRATPADLDVVIQDVATWRPIAVAAGLDTAVAELDGAVGLVAFIKGDVDGAQQKLEAAWRAYKPHHKPTHRTTVEVSGIVVDSAGQPVAGATVAVDRVLSSVSHSIVFPQSLDAFRSVVTDEHGKFSIPDASQDSVAVAQHGDQRSLAELGTTSTRLVLAPTRRITGRIELGTGAPTNLIVTVAPSKRGVAGYYSEVAPVSHDGSFDLDGVPTDEVHIGAVGRGNVDLSVQMVTFPAGREPVKDVTITMNASTRELVVIVRSTMSTTLQQAQVMVFTGHVQAKVFGDLLGQRISGATSVEFATSVSGEKAPPDAIGVLERGDLLAQFKTAPPGELTVCAVPLPDDVTSPRNNHLLQTHRMDLELKCVPAAADAKVIVVETPPQKRLD